MARERGGDLRERVRQLQERLDEAEETLRALRSGEVDAVVATGPEGDRVYTLEGADKPYRVMVQQMAEGALTLAPDGLILFSNEQFASMMGIPLERVIGSRIHDYVAAEDAPAVSSLLSGYAGSRKVELRLKADGARVVPAHLASNNLLFGGAECICLIVTDLTAQKHSEEMVAAERLARSILDQAAGALLVVDSGGTIIRASRAAGQLANGPVLLREFDAAFCLRAAPAAGDYTFEKIWAAVRRGESIAGQQATARTADGRSLDVIFSAAPLAGAGSEPMGCIIILSDISSLKRTEDALRESESRLRALGDSLPECAIYRYSRDRHQRPRFEFISAGIERLTGVPASEILHDAAALDRTILTEDLERMAAAIELSRERLTRFEIEIRHTHRITRELRWSLLRSMPHRRPDGGTVWEGIQLDITGQKRSAEELRAKEDQLRQAQKMESIGVLAGGIAHDFNNLLTGVLGNASLVLDDLPAGDPNRPAIEGIVRSADRAADLTRQLLAYSGKGRFIVEPLNLSGSIRDMADLLRSSVPANIAIEFDLQEEMAAMNADPGQIEQIVMNLVLNASEAIGNRAGRIVIGTRTRSVDAAMIAQARLEIPPGPTCAWRCRIPVQGWTRQPGPGSSSRSSQRNSRAAGWGWRPCTASCARMGARYSVYSHPGQGSQFTVLLPAAEVTQSDAGGSGLPDPAATIRSWWSMTKRSSGRSPKLP